MGGFLFPLSAEAFMVALRTLQRNRRRMNKVATPRTAALERLEVQVRRDLATIEAPPAGWMRARLAPGGRPAFDVIVIGAGLSGLSIGFGLRRQGIDNFLILDQRPAGREGPWITCARMATLRSPKQLTGPDLGVPSLTFRSWFEAVAGEEAWVRLDKIAPRDWMAYLSWYRRVLDLPVQNETRLAKIDPVGNLLALSVHGPDGAATLYCRRVVLATGVDGSGRPHVPELIAATLAPDRYTHSAAEIDPAVFSGRDIGVLGAGASAFDWATSALENGARSVVVFARRRELPKTEALAWANFPGFLGGFSELDDARRWRFMRRFFELQPPPTQDMFERAARHPGFRLAMGAPWRRVAMAGTRIRIETAEANWSFDHILLGTGFETDLARRPELAGFIEQIALWSDRFTPPPGEEDAQLARYPYLGHAFELTERTPGAAPYLGRIHIFNNGAVPSLGPVCNGVTGLKYGAPKIVAGIARGFFLEDADEHIEGLMRYDVTHFRADEFVMEAPNGVGSAN
jgi:cation diffusion facilitator CzcD-associated flavoprotein CzcO